MAIVLRTAVLSDVGRVRTGNEDSAVAGPRLAAVADGMGGHADGEVASAIAVSVLRRLETRQQEADLVTDLTSTLDEVNTALRKAIAAGQGEQGMGTTITALLTDGEQLALAHVGDSRGYRLRDGRVEQITKDQTFIQMLLDEGRITPAEARVHPRRSVVLQAMTGEPDIEPQAEIIETEIGDRWLICSDGLSDMLEQDEIQMSLSIPDRLQAAQRLLDLALTRGAPDNVTVVIADVEADGDVEEVPSIAGAALSPPSFTDTSPTLVKRESTRRLVPARIRRPLLARIWVIPIATVLVLGALVGVASIYVNNQYYVGNSNGMVVVFHGVPKLSSVMQRTAVPVDALTADAATTVNSHSISGSKKHVLELLQDFLISACLKSDGQLTAACTAAREVQP